MILMDVKNFIVRRGEGSVYDVAAYFSIEPSAAQGMLELLLRKGLVVACGGCPGGGCGTCPVGRRYRAAVNV